MGVAPSSRVAAQRGTSRLRWTAVGSHTVKATAAIALAVLAIWLMAGHASGDNIYSLLRFWIFGITLPGTTLWRLASPFRHSLIEDFAAGSLVGVSVLTLVYMAVAPIGGQQWAWLWAAPVLALVVAVPSWRRTCLSRVERPVSPLAAWLIAAACALPLYAVGRARNLAPAPYTDARSNLPDMAFHQALSASAKYDFPLQAPYVNGEQMHYHYFWHQFTAATSWATGVDLTDLIYTIGWLPLLLAGVALIFALTDRLAPGSRWAGPLAIAVASVGGTVNPYTNTGLPNDGLINYVWGSPTQNLGGGLVVLLALLGVDLLRGRGRPRTWLMFVLIGAAASGSKATVLPMIICGLGLVVFVRLCYGKFAKGALLMCMVFGGLFAGRHRGGFRWSVVGDSRSGPGSPSPRSACTRWSPSRNGASSTSQAMWITAITMCLGLILGSAGLLVLTGTTRAVAPRPRHDLPGRHRHRRFRWHGADRPARRQPDVLPPDRRTDHRRTGRGRRLDAGLLVR